MNRSGLKLNLGSGQRPFGEGWINVDSQAKWKPDIIADCANLRGIFDDNSARLIVLHHVLEHFGCGEADAMLRECHRILNPLGTLLVFVPDMQALARMWIEGRLTDQIYMTNLYGAYMGSEDDRHKWGFTWQSLSETLKRAGFNHTITFSGRKIEGADIAKDRWILGMEGIK